MRLGTDDKRKVYTFISLFLIAALIAAWESLGDSNRHFIATAHLSQSNVKASQHSADSTQGQNDVDIDLIIFHTSHLARIEQIEYSTIGRNIFSSESTASPTEMPLAPARPSPAATSPPAPIPERPRPPAIDLKYLGYAQGNDRINDAILMRGEESLMARSGEVVFHHYEIGSIQPTSVQVTDLTNNNTQTITVTEK